MSTEFNIPRYFFFFFGVYTPNQPKAMRRNIPRYAAMER